MGADWGIIIDAIGNSLSIVGTCGHLLKEGLSILVMGTMDVSGPYHCPSILEVGLHGQSLIVVVGAGCVLWWL